MNMMHDYDETGADYETLRLIIDGENKRREFIRLREKRIAIFSNMVKKMRRELFGAKQGKLNI